MANVTAAMTAFEIRDTLRARGGNVLDVMNFNDEGEAPVTVVAVSGALVPIFRQILEAFEGGAAEVTIKPKVGAVVGSAVGRTYLPDITLRLREIDRWWKNAAACAGVSRKIGPSRTLDVITALGRVACDADAVCTLLADVPGPDACKVRDAAGFLREYATCGVATAKRYSLERAPIRYLREDLADVAGSAKALAALAERLGIDPPA